MAEAQKIITSSDVHLFYGKFEALKGINLDFNEHEITALIGPSGCGKSTYLRTLNRMNDLIPGVTITGTISLRGQNIYAPSEDVVQYVSKWAWSSNNPIRFLSPFTKM